ncbi:MAG: TatD family hydrolase [Anaerolineae bacterium]
MELVDSHCHLNFRQFDDDRAQVVDRAARAGVKRLVTPGTNLTTSREAVALARRYPNLFAAVGIHPHDAAGLNDDSLAALARLARAPGVVAIGEIGLDYYRNHAPKPAQRRAFEAQLALAKTLRLPVIIHQREAAADTMAVLRQWALEGGHPGVVLHAFSGSAELVNRAAGLGFYMGIGGPVTFKNAAALRQTVSQIPLDRLLVETDAPFLSPHPHRGKRNEPARVLLVAQTLAGLFNLTLAALAEQVTKNAQTLFKLPPAV